MKIISCVKCGKKIRIPDDKHIRFKCPNVDCRYAYEYKNGQPINPTIISNLTPALAITIAIIGSFFSYLFPIPLLVGSTWFIWWLFKGSEIIWHKMLSRLAFSTAIGLSFLLTILLIINTIDTKASIEIPKWLINLDDFLIDLNEELEHIFEIYVGIYVIIIISLLAIAYKKPDWKPVSKFILVESWIGKLSFILIVITSFTFFSNYSLDKTIDNRFYQHYRVIYREKLKQERRKLIANSLRKRIEEKDTTGYASNISSFKDELKSLTLEKLNPSIEAKYDVERVMELAGEIKVEEAVESNNTDWSGSEEKIKREWKKAVDIWQDQSLKSIYANLKNDHPNTYRKRSRKIFLELNIEELRRSKILADEFVEALTAIFSKFFGVYLDSKEKTIFRKYLEEVVNTSAEYLLELNKVAEIISQFLNDKRSKGRLDLFARVGSFWQIIYDRRKEENERIMKQKEVEDIRKLENENSDLAKKIMHLVEHMKIQIDKNRFPQLTSIFDKKGIGYIKKQLILLLTNQDGRTSKMYNEFLNSNIKLLDNNINEILSQLERKLCGC